MSGPIKKVVVLGATGNVGKPITTALADAGYIVTAASRSEGKKFPDPIIPAVVDYSSIDALVDLFKGQDAVVEAFPPNAAHMQPAIVDACLKAGTVKHIITPDFAGDTFSPHISELPLYVPKVEAQKQLEEKIKGTDLTWSAIITGGWYDWAIPLGYYWINPQTNTITVYGSGNQRNSMCRVGTAAKAVCDVLADPAKFKNRPVYVADHTVSMNQLIPMLEEAKPGWNIVKVDLDAFFAEAKRLWDEDTKKGVEVRLLTPAYNMLGTYGIFEENNRYNADFERLIEPGYGYQKPLDELREELKTLVGAK
ncbi:hypothetical protein HRR83_005559 [Exophiala dermatitidis]|uniref:NmrA-like domain-containing protein n=2 Tax=Exophiala dermatitidis TaxID=5970 RepID=H6BW85_EXODN|nr:uncharacterized protein HMPREF1120_03335 [Exophiala dermatitidis NIH/UT8656]KAJ4502464.1 hypothetical protein HRR75_008444 [Exophiala dermatitidis]EHY55185.1 hypothetical protein HMPREF1120_03335 [Exophiala dermatitidis NIH/UT8656]KAJ4503790.1 hypothetical protein HRR74_009181 [Exophiala dermatitidis]KAJ4508169.1 hypothetical protein HRR73_007608 [Exophiala dermatitidis]KAJ4537879.1 hypothetical protein HRR78_008471 [Exophiala dermatitidis]